MGEASEAGVHGEVVGAVSVPTAWTAESEVHVPGQFCAWWGYVALNLFRQGVGERLPEHDVARRTRPHRDSEKVTARVGAGSIEGINRRKEHGQVQSGVRRKVGQGQGDGIASGTSQEGAAKAVSHGSQAGIALNGGDGRYAGLDL